MEAKKTLLILFSVFLLFSCARPFKPEEPLRFKEKGLSNQSEEVLFQNQTSELQIKGKIKSEDPFKEPEPLKLPSFQKRLTQKPLPPPPEEKKEEKPPLDYKALVGVKDLVLLNVERMPLNDFIVYALGELLKVAFLIDDEVMRMTNPVTLRLPTALPPEEVLKAIVFHLEGLGLEVSQQGKVLSIKKPKPKPAPPPPRIEQILIGDEALETSAQVAQFVPLKYVRTHEIESLLRELVRGISVDIKTYPKENAFFFTGPGYQMKSLLEVIRLLDLPYFAEKKLYLHKLTFWQPEEFVKELTNLLTKLGYPVANNIKEPGIMLLPIKGLNSVILAFPDEKAFEITFEWIKRLDSPEAAGTEAKFYIYRPLYSKAVELAESLGRVITGQAKISQGAPQPQAPPPRVGAPTTPQLTTFSTSGLSITADEKRNLLLITATPSQYQMVLQVLKELDRPPRQVLIEATILELTLKDELKLGLEWYIRNRLTGGNFTLGQILGVPSSPGFTFTVISDTARFNLLLNLFASRGLTNILSTPRLMVLDNQQATIQVGTDVPVVTGEVATAQATTGTTAGVVRSIQYRNTGVILTVKPTIYTEGMLQLDITQEVSEMGTSPPGLASPTILVRKINTGVVAGDGQTIILGGLISNTRGREESKVPFLGDIPLLGNLFKSQSHEERKTELIVLLRPYIIKSLEDARAVTEELKERLKWLK
jgi:general secretion pathway protein D